MRVKRRLAKPLSARQERLLRAIPIFWRTRGIAPTIRDLQEMCELKSTSITDYNVNRLVERGLVLRDRGVARSIRLATGPAPKRKE